jgi:hypothetical protein
MGFVGSTTQHGFCALEQTEGMQSNTCALKRFMHMLKCTIWIASTPELRRVSLHALIGLTPL